MMICLFLNSATAPITATFPESQRAYAETDEIARAVGEVVAGDAYVLDEERFVTLFPQQDRAAFAPGKWVACHLAGCS